MVIVFQKTEMGWTTEKKQELRAQKGKLKKQGKKPAIQQTEKLRETDRANETQSVV